MKDTEREREMGLGKVSVCVSGVCVWSVCVCVECVCVLSAGFQMSLL
jgi:hypothetical protein